MRTASAKKSLDNVLHEYRENGFCILKNAIQKEVLINVLEEINSVFALILKKNNLKTIPFKDDQTLYQNMQTLFNFNVQLYLAAARHIAKLVSLQNLVSSPAVLEITKLFGIKIPTIPSSPVVHISSDKLKIPGGYYGVAPHQDWPSIQGGLDSIVMWMPFMDIDVNRFPLEVIPGSHKKGLWEGKIEEHTYTIKPELLNENDFKRYTVNLGDVLIMSVFTVHQTGLKNSSGLRIASSTRYENSEDTTFIERGYPCAYQRKVHREFFTPDFPTKEQVNKAINDKN